MNQMRAQQNALPQMMTHQQGVTAMPFGIAGWANAANAAAALGGVSVGVGQPSPPLEPLPTGMKVEDLIGWRIWRVTNSYLWSFSYNYAWMPGDVSEGDPGDHDHAGIWAFKAKQRAFQKAIENGPGYVWGSVRLWGHVVEHKDGFRASKARIVSLDGGTRDITPEVMTDLCRMYRVPEIMLPARVVRVASSIEDEFARAVNALPAVARIVPFGEQPPLMERVESNMLDTPWWRVVGVLAGLLAAVAALLTLFRL